MHICMCGLVCVSACELKIQINKDRLCLICGMPLKELNSSDSFEKMNAYGFSFNYRHIMVCTCWLNESGKKKSSVFFTDSFVALLSVCLFCGNRYFGVWQMRSSFVSACVRSEYAFRPMHACIVQFIGKIQNATVQTHRVGYKLRGRKGKANQ